MANEALNIANIPFSVTSQIKRAPHWTMIRELTMNAIEAAARASGEKIVYWTTGQYKGVRKAVIWNTGPGMDAAELKAATNLACQVNKNLGLDENFGVGAKVSSLANNKIGMRFRSCKNGIVSEVIVGYDPEIDQFVRFERDLPNGDSDTVINVTTVAQKEGRSLDYDWTEVMLLGNSLEQDTVDKPFESNVIEKAYVATALYRRFYRIPEGVKLRLDTCYHRLDGTRPFIPIGQRYTKFGRVESVRVSDMNLTIHFLHDPAVSLGLRKSSSNALGSSTTTCALVFKDEMYSVMTGNEWSAAAPRFGIPFGSKELCVHIELDEGEARPSQYRERLITRETGEDLLPSDFTFAVIQVMPEWVKDVIRAASPRRSEDYNDLRKELQELLNRLKVKVTGRKMQAQNGTPSKEQTGQDLGTTGSGVSGGTAVGTGNNGSGSGVRNSRRRFHETPEGATATALYEIYEKPPQIEMLETLEEVTEKNLKGRAAEFILETGVLFVNGLYEAVERTVNDVEPEFVGQADPETIRKCVINAARRALAFRTGKATVYALAKRANEDWSETAMLAALSKESLSIAADNYDESLTSVKRNIREAIKMEKVAA